MIITRKGKISRPLKTVIYGPEGVGKSSIASHAPDPLFIDLDGGTAQLDVNRIETPVSWEMLLDNVKEIAATPQICKTLIIDTADKAEALCSQYICRKHHVSGIESLGYGKGYTYLQEEYDKFLAALDQVILSGKNVFVIAHAKMRKMELPDEAGAFDRWELKMTKQVAPLVKEWSDALLFCNFKTHVITTGNNVKKGQGNKRVIYTSHNATYDAKNRFGLPEELDMDYKNIAVLFPDIPQDSSETPLEQLHRLMSENGITDEEVQKVVGENMKELSETNIKDYSNEFIEKTLIPNLDELIEVIHKNRTVVNKTPIGVAP